MPVPQSPGPAWNKEIQILSSGKDGPSSGLFHCEIKQTRGKGLESLRPSTKSPLGTSGGWHIFAVPAVRAYLGRSAAGTGVGASTGRTATFRSPESPGSTPPAARRPLPAARSQDPGRQVTRAVAQGGGASGGATRGDSPRAAPRRPPWVGAGLSGTFSVNQTRNPVSGVPMRSK